MPFDPRRLPGYRLLQALRDITLGGDRRTSALLRLSGPELLFQPFGDTAPDRYPEIFAAIADGLADRSAPGLLSFGCSTGDEVFTLHRYLPQASIRGVDISADRIAICRSRLERETPETKARVRFDLAVAGDIEPAAAYDAVLAMAVFRHGDLVDGRAKNTLIAFDDFDRVVTSLAASVKPGGYLALRHSNFRFTDTTASADFDLVLSQENITPVYDRDGDRLPHAPVEPCLFRKRPAG